MSPRQCCLDVATVVSQRAPHGDKYLQGGFEISNGHMEIGIYKTRIQLREKVNRQTSRRQKYQARVSKKPLQTKVPWRYVRMSSNEGPVFTFSTRAVQYREGSQIKFHSFLSLGLRCWSSDRTDYRDRSN